MRDEKTKKLVVMALFTALTTAATMVVRVPSPTGGYVNAGDAVVLLGAFLLGPAAGMVTAGVGSALADVFGVYFLYAPATLVIKGLTALAAGLVLRGAAQNVRPLRAVLAGVLGETVMVGGYYVFEALFVTNSWAGALMEIPGNLVQGAFGVAAGTALLFALRDTPLVRAHAAR